MPSNPSSNAAREPAALPSAWRIGATLLSAALFTLAFPPSEGKPLAWIAVAPFLFAVRCGSRSAALGMALLWSLTAMSMGITDWLVDAVSSYYDQSRWLGVAMLVGSTLYGASGEYMVFAIAYRRAARLHPCLAVPLAGAAWVACELARTRIHFGNPWGVFGYSLAGLPYAPTDWRETVLHGAPSSVLQVADLGGVYAVSFVLVAVNAAVAESLVSIVERPRRARPTAGWACAILILGAAMVYGHVRIADSADKATEPRRIAIVQGNLDNGSRWNRDMYGRNLDRYLRTTYDVARKNQPVLVFWPENAMTFFLDNDPPYRRAIGRVLRPIQIQLVAGAPRYEGDPAEARYFNSVFVVDPSGEIADRYDKRRLFPFAEYFPLPVSDYVRRSFGRARHFTPGQPTGPLDTRIGSLGMLICNEAMYPTDARERVAEGATVLANLTNDTWVASPEFAEQQLKIASMRAIEQRRFLARASTSGPSAIVDPLGRIVRRTATRSEAVLVGEVEERTERSVYSHIGDRFAWLCVLFALLGVLRPGLARGRHPLSRSLG